MATEIFRTIAGSNLFGTSLPTSDLDWKAVHIPSARNILLGRTTDVIDRSTGSKDTSNTADDTDFLSLPVQHFLKSVAKMETNALEMLHAPHSGDNEYWNMIVENKFRIMSHNKKCFTGYAKGQAMRYAVRGDRFDSLTQVVAVLKACDPRVPMVDQDIRRQLAAIHGVSITERHDPDGDGFKLTPYINAFGRQCPMTCLPKEALKVYEKPLKEAGKRTREAADGGGPDWKGLYHAQRIVDEGMELFTKGTMTFPCEDAEYYKAIRTGQIPLDTVLDYFEQSLALLESVEPIPAFRESPDMEWIEEFVHALHEQEVVSAYESWKTA